MQTEEERLLDRFTDNLYNGTNGNSNDNDDKRNIEDGSINPAQMAKTMDVDCDDDIDGDDNDGDTKAVNSNGTGDGNGSGDGSGDGNGNGVSAALLPGVGRNVSANINVKKCAVKKIVLNQEVIEYAKADLEELNLGKVRVCEGSRRLRAKLMSTAVMDSVTAMHNLG